MSQRWEQTETRLTRVLPLTADLVVSLHNCTITVAQVGRPIQITIV
jgi:hypothetical protein